MGTNCGILVSSEQIFEDSLALASIGENTFLSFLLSRVQNACPRYTKVFSMAFSNFQKMRESLINHIRSFGFEVFLGEPDGAGRMAKAARVHGLDLIVDIQVDSPLVSLHFIDDMVAAHNRAASDLTLCHNLPHNLAPVVLTTEALERFNSLASPAMQRYYGLSDGAPLSGPYYRTMATHPHQFAVNWFAAPLQWQGARFDPFDESVLSLRLTKKEDLPLLRDLIYTVNKDDLTCEDVVDYVLIGNMRKVWGKGDEFDTKRIVADQKEGTTDEEYRKWCQKEIDWFVLNDPKFLNCADASRVSILEVGCGHGRLVKLLAPVFQTVLGVDSSRERYLEGRYRLRDLPNVFLTHGDGRSLSPYADNSVDLCFAHGVFVHINSKSIINNYVREMARVVRKEGRIKFDIYHGRDIFGITTNTFGLGARYTDEEIEEVIRSAGLRLVSNEHVFTRQFFRDAADGNEYSALPLEQMLVIGEK